ncbi:hypothetical protein [Bacteroides sp. 519]|uniref:hypothetical protein n=1 Tax=Bacteroides sp. 519 TaxID=2302937 RepID=UPI0013D7F6B8|nr:hypothetical protein [Bacteroides sp. 519]NDV58771.1 hypothetical protein [Bacteroides sp. 519]
MKTITFDENTEAGRTLMSMIRNMKASVRKTIHVADEVVKISGLPYTKEERIESLQRAEEDIATGRVSSNEDVMMRIKEKIQGWK